jgi:ATP-dependent helicase HrpB
LAWETRPLPDATPEELGAALIEGVRDLGLDRLPWSDDGLSLRSRVRWLAAQGADMPDWSDAGLTTRLEDWLGPLAAGRRRLEDLSGAEVAAALGVFLGRKGSRLLDAAAPARLRTPGGVAVAIDYSRDRPVATLRPQLLYGLDSHPSVSGAPLALELVSPAGRPVATTSDLPGFWRGSWADVRRDMRGRYPKHDWPEAPWTAAPLRNGRSGRA